MNYENDIEERIEKYFKDTARVKKILGNLNVDYEYERIIRCILVLSESDFDSVESWVNKANIDVRNVLFYAEYDNRNIRRYNYNYPLNKQNEYTYSE